MITYLLPRSVPAFVNDNINYPSRFRNPNMLAVPLQIGTGPVTLYGYNLVNRQGSAVFVKLFNSVASPVVGTAIPVETIQIASNGSVVFFGYAPFIYFNLGMWAIVVTGSLDNSTTAPGNPTIAQFKYK